jgi:hypothetical protein
VRIEIKHPKTLEFVGMQPASASLSIPALRELMPGERALAINRSHRLVTAAFVLEPMCRASAFFAHL